MLLPPPKGSGFPHLIEFMKICEIHDDYRNMLVGYLYYYEDADAYLIEMPETLKKQNVPIFFEKFVRDRCFTIDPIWSARYVRTRIVPRDRQNLGAILKNAGLSEYDTFRLLMMAEGRCSQDDCSIRPVKTEPDWLVSRRKQWIRNAYFLGDFRMCITFHDGTIKVIDMRTFFEKDRAFKILLLKENDFNNFTINGSGRYIDWGAERILMYDRLYEKGEQVPFSIRDLEKIFMDSTVDVSEICERYMVSKQYVNKKLKAEGILPIRKCGSSALYRTSEVREVFEK